MNLAIGDVVRDRSDMTLCTVAGIVNKAGGNRVALGAADGAVRLVKPENVDLVARYSRPMTRARSVVTLIFLVLGCVAAFFGARSIQGLDGGWPLSFLTSLGSYTAVMSALRWVLRLTEPRRIRV